MIILQILSFNSHRGGKKKKLMGIVIILLAISAVYLI